MSDRDPEGEATVPVYLVRHGDAKAEAEDPARPLSVRGRAAIERVARHAAAMGLRVAEIRHSGLLRARETAEILAARLAPGRGVHEMAGLGPNDDPGVARAACEAADDGVMLVGHLPHLGRLTSALLTGDAGRDLVRFGPGMIVCLARAERGGWELVGAWGPELAPAGDC